jgi:hypothetical protein
LATRNKLDAVSGRYQENVSFSKNVRINTARYDRYFFVEDLLSTHTTHRAKHNNHVHVCAFKFSRLSGRLFDIVVVAMRR